MAAKSKENIEEVKVEAEAVETEAKAEETAEAPKKTTRKRKTAAKAEEAEAVAAETAAEAEAPAETETPTEPDENTEGEAKEGDGAPAKKTRRAPRGGWKKAIPKEGEIEDLIQAKIDRRSFGSEIANAEKRRELMSSEHVVTETGHEDVETLATIRNREFQNLAGAAKSDRILEGEVVGVRLADPEVMNEPEARTKEVSTVLADVLYGNGFIQVSIPSYVFFNYREESYRGREGMLALQEHMKHRLGSTIKFCVSYVNQATGECYGDRLKALSMTGTRQYLMPYHGPNSDPNMQAGLIAKSRITCVERNAVIVDALGAEIRIPKEELSYLHIGDARDMFKIDDFVNVKVLTVEEENVVRGGNKYRLVKATGSIKQGGPDPRKLFFNNFPIGKQVPGIITHITDDGNVYCMLNNGQMDCMCAYPKRGDEPRVGQKRIIRINDRNEDDLHLYGMFVAP